MSELSEAAKSKPALEQYRDFIEFVTASLDDPGNCAALDALDDLNRIERQLVSLVIDRRPVAPQRLLHCEAVDSDTQHCDGIQADDTPLVPETELGKLPPPFPKSSTALSFSAVSGYPITVVSVYGGSIAAFSQDHPHPLSKLNFHDSSISIARLRKIKHPVIVVVFRVEDQLHYRKAVWTF